MKRLVLGAMILIAACPAPAPQISARLVGDCPAELARNSEVCDGGCSGKPGDYFTIGKVPVGCVFEGWSGACLGTDECMPGAGSATASVKRVSWPIKVQKIGAGAGTLISTDKTGETECADACEHLVPVGSSIKVTARVVAGSHLSAFSGDCSGTTCTLVSDGPKQVTGKFDVDQKFATLSASVTGFGTVSSMPAGISCRADAGSCSGSFPNGTQVTLTAQPDPGNRFTAWTGQLCDGPTCSIPLDGDQRASAGFVPTVVLTLGFDGGTSPSVDIGGQAYPLPLTRLMDPGTKIRLHAVPQAHETSLGWSGLPCEELQPLQRCTLTMTRDLAGTLRVAPFARWIVGGYGVLESSALLSEDRVAFLGFAGSVNQQRIQIVAADAGLWVDAAPPRRVEHLVETSGGFFALNDVSPGSPLDWSSFDGGIAATAGVAAFSLDPSTLVASSVSVAGHATGDVLKSVPAPGLGVLTSCTSGAPNGYLRVLQFSPDFRGVVSLGVWDRVADGAVFIADAGVVVLGNRVPGPASDCALAGAQVLSMLEPGTGNCVAATDVGVAGLRPVRDQIILSESIATGLRWKKLHPNFVQAWVSAGARSLEAVTGTQTAIVAGKKNQLIAWLAVGGAARDIEFTNGLVIRCPVGAPMARYSSLLLTLDEQTGAIEWGHCLPGTSPEGTTTTYLSLHPMAGGALLTLRARDTNATTISLGARTAPINPFSPYSIWLTPP